MIKSRSRAELHLACWSSSLLRKYFSAPRKTLLRHLHLPEVKMMVKMKMIMMKLVNMMKMMMLIMMKHISAPRKNLHLPEVILMMLITQCLCHNHNHQFYLAIIILNNHQSSNPRKILLRQMHLPNVTFIMLMPVSVVIMNMMFEL